MTSRTRRARKNRSWRPRIMDSRLRGVRRSILAAGCGITLAAGLWYGVPSVVRLAKSHPYFILTTIQVDGNRRLSRREILQWAGVGERTSIWDATPAIVGLRLQSHPWIQRVSVGREFPNRLIIGVEERRPVAIVRLEELNYVDRRGRILGPLQDGDSRDFPLITGLENAQTADFRPIGVHRALRFLHLCERRICFDAVSEVHVDRNQGITVFPLRTAVAVVLGWGSWGEKLARSARVFAAWGGQVGRLAAVDVSFRDLVVVKLHEERHPAAVRSQKGVRV
ncbi:MAG TPA: FtsQ-type POTRA domain-containing protein [Candidatus Binatia bacterium]|jgi:cell division protein FtsQ